MVVFINQISILRLLCSGVYIYPTESAELEKLVGFIQLGPPFLQILDSHPIHERETERQVKEKLQSNFAQVSYK